jgi:hypothetical protein
VAALLAFGPLSATQGGTHHWSALTRQLAVVAGSTCAALLGIQLRTVAVAAPEKELAPGVVQQGDRLILTPEKWVGHRLPIINLLDEEREWLRSGQLEVWIVDPDCRASRAAIEGRIQRIPPFSPELQLAVIVVNSRGNNDAWLIDLVGLEGMIRFSSKMQVVCPFPTSVKCADNLIVTECSVGNTRSSPEPTRILD